MSLAGKLFRFFIYSNLFIALCAVLMVYQTSNLLLHSSPGVYFIFFVFFATICSYSFHWYLTAFDAEAASSRMEWLRRNRNVHSILFFIGLAGAGVCCLYSAPKIPHPWFRLLRKVALGKTIFLALVWVHVTTIVPLVISGQPWQPVFTVFVISRFFLVYAICILFDYRDRQYDRKVGIRSLITWLSERNITILFAATLVVFGTFTIWMISFDQPFITILMLLIPGALTAFLYSYARRNFSDLLYYFVLDGLMALSALLTLLFGD
jgi:1,4-dihydroxy-2-naphthoate octaprenyltransferase